MCSVVFEKNLKTAQLGPIHHPTSSYYVDNNHLPISFLRITLTVSSVEYTIICNYVLIIFIQSIVIKNYLIRLFLQPFKQPDH